jgi:hypothetical protein
MESLFENLLEIELIRQNLLYDALWQDVPADLRQDPNVVLKPLQEVERIRQLIRSRLIEDSLNGNAQGGIWDRLSTRMFQDEISNAVADSRIPIATCTHLVRHDTGAAIQIEIWQPICDASPTKQWTCNYRIIGLDEPVERAAPGADSIAALRLVYEAIRADLRNTKLRFGFNPELSSGNAGLNPPPDDYTGFERYQLEPPMEELLVHVMEAERLQQKVFHQMLVGETSSQQADMEALLFHIRESEILRQRILGKIVKRKRKS